MGVQSRHTAQHRQMFPKVNMIVQAISVPRCQTEPDFFFFIDIHSKVHILDALGWNKEKLSSCCQLCSRPGLAAARVRSAELQGHGAPKVGFVLVPR